MVIRSLAAALAVAGALAMPATAEEGTTETTLSRGSFSATLAPNNAMTCTGTLPSRICTHKWDATTCFEAAATSPYGTLGCDFATTSGFDNKTQGTGATTAAGIVCTTTNIGTVLSVGVKVRSVFFGEIDVAVDVVQTNGVGVFRGFRTLTNRSVFVEGTFTTPGASKGGPCGPFASNGSIQGTFTVSLPV